MELHPFTPEGKVLLMRIAGHLHDETARYGHEPWFNETDASGRIPIYKTALTEAARDVLALLLPYYQRPIAAAVNDLLALLQKF